MDQSERTKLIHESEVLLRQLFDSWKSEYKYTISFNSMTNHTVFFDTEWCRAPSPHKPVPSVVVIIHFAVQYERAPSDPRTIPLPFTPSKFLFPLPPLSKGTPHVSWRVQHEETVQEDLTCIDHHILRVMKFKTLFFDSFDLSYQHRACFESRLQGDIESSDQQDLGPSGAEGYGAVTSHTLLVELPAGVEPALNKAYSKADPARSGHLAYAAFHAATVTVLTAFNLFLEAHVPHAVALTHYDIAQCFLTAHREFSVPTTQLGALPSRITGKLSGQYGLPELLTQHALPAPAILPVDAVVPISQLASTVIQLLRTLLCVSLARRAYASTLASALSASHERLRACPEVHEAMGEPLLSLDPEQTGSLEEEALVRFLGRLPVGLREHEVEDILAQLPRTPEGRYAYLPLQARYESMIREVVTARAMEVLSTDVTGYLGGLLKQKQEQDVVAATARAIVTEELATGNPADLISAPATLEALLCDSDRVRFPPVQVFGLLRGQGYVGEDLSSVLSLGSDGAVVFQHEATLHSDEDAVVRAQEIGDKSWLDFGGAFGAPRRRKICAGMGVVSVSTFTQLAGLAVYKLNESDVLATGTQLSTTIPSLSALAQSQAPVATRVAGLATNGRVDLRVLIAAHAPDAEMDPRLAELLSHADTEPGVLSHVVLPRVGAPETESYAAHMFRSNDADDDGMLSPSEFHALMAGTGVCISAAQIDDIFRAADTNVDNYVDWDEFLAVFPLLLRLAAAQRINDNVAFAEMREHVV